VGSGSITGSNPNGAVAVTVVHAPACHFCDDALDALRRLSQQYPLTVATVAADSPEGERLVRVHAAGMFPLVLVDGRFFSQGRLPRGKLRKLLGTRTSPVAVV